MELLQFCTKSSMLTYPFCAWDDDRGRFHIDNLVGSCHHFWLLLRCRFRCLSQVVVAAEKVHQSPVGRALWFWAYTRTAAQSCLEPSHLHVCLNLQQYQHYQGNDQARIQCIAAAAPARTGSGPWSGVFHRAYRMRGPLEGLIDERGHDGGRRQDATTRSPGTGSPVSAVTGSLCALTDWWCKSVRRWLRGTGMSSGQGRVASLVRALRENLSHRGPGLFLWRPLEAGVRWSHPQ